MKYAGCVERMEEIRNAILYFVANTERRASFGKTERTSKMLKRIFRK
jgi:hypothetical protein